MTGLHRYKIRLLQKECVLDSGADVRYLLLIELAVILDEPGGFDRSYLFGLGNAIFCQSARSPCQKYVARVRPVWIIRVSSGHHDNYGTARVNSVSADHDHRTCTTLL